MEYRSSVTLAIKNESFVAFQDVMSSPVRKEFLESADKYEKAGWTLLVWDWIKWYDGLGGYDEVTAVVNFMGSLEIKGKSGEFFFLVTGAALSHSVAALFVA